MKKRKLWKDIKKCFMNSKGRFISIFCLMMLGSFALVGLKVSGPDMRETGLHYFEALNLSDLTVIGDYGIDETNQKAIDQLSGTKKIEYGYLKDVEIKNTTDSIRLFSNPETISKYELTAGKNTEKENEIVLSDTYKDQYKIGDTIKVTEKESNGIKVLKKHSFKIVGFAKSSEFLSSINMGQSTSGTGELKGYGFVNNAVFDSDFYMIARMTFRDTANVDPYSDEYTDLIQTHTNELDDLLEDQPKLRLQALKEEYQSNIDDGQEQIDEAKQKLADAKEQLASGETTLTEKWTQLQSAKQSLDSAKNTLLTTETQLNAAYEALQDGWTKINTANSALSSKEAQLTQVKETIASDEQELSQKTAEFQQKQQEYQTALSEFTEKQQEYQTASQELASQQNVLDSNKNALTNAKQDYETAIASCTQTVNSLKQQLTDPNLSQEEEDSLTQKLTAAEAKLEKYQAEYQSFLNDTYTPQMNNIESMQDQLDLKKAELQQAKASLDEKESELNTAKQQLDSAQQEINTASAKLAAAKNQVASNEAQLNEAKQSLAEQKSLLETKQAEYNSGYALYQSGVTSYNSNLDTYYQGLSTWKESAQTLSSKEEEYQDKEYDAENEISENEEKLDDAKEEMNNLEMPLYTISTRRESPGSGGYKIYNSVSTIIDALANVFPIFLYFVAALVTLTTMTRFVDEERMNSGTLKALGYTDRDVMKKFTVYGLIAGISGTIAGILLGHLLLPEIIYNAYGNNFDVPVIEKHFYITTSLAALLLSILSAVLPACIVASRELREKPAALLLPKAPTKGSKIFLERLTPLWKRMSFTHKVTARNIFRYKKRMFMTIFGVCGAVTLLFTGFSVQNSIAQINDRQFGEIIKYDLIVAQNSHLDKQEQKDLDSLLNSDSIKQQLPVHYESVTKVAGKKNDKQEITMIVTQDANEFRDYFSLVHRKDQTKINLGDDGVVISERLAKLLDVKVGDSFTITDSNDKEHTVKVADITEMYTGHFIFMNDSYYEKAFSETYQTNANLVSLNDRSVDNAQKQASRFMQSDAVKGVVQNTTMINQINTIVTSLNKIMEVLILVAVLLAIVILYNLTNINVAERIRELSTIKVLGFYDKEVTLYIYRETILLSLLGILAGFGVGDLLYQYILAVVPPMK